MENKVEPILISIHEGELSVTPEKVTAQILRALQNNRKQFNFTIEVLGREEEPFMMKSGGRRGKGI